MSETKSQPWKPHWVPQPGNTAVVSYQEEKGAEIIADGGSAGPAIDETAEKKPLVASVRAENRLCPHLKPITNPTL